jgi:integrative and conjugative element protein (TIGR02256 family)
MNTRYDMGDGLYLEFSEAVAETFQRYRQRHSANEAGGILMGRVYPGSHVVVEVATTPGHLDYAGPYFFNRSRRAAQEIVNRAWRESGGAQNYLGEWHSHPVPRPTPSGRDRQMIRNMIRESILGVNFLILVVVGVGENWVGLETGSALKLLKPTKA